MSTGNSNLVGGCCYCWIAGIYSIEKKLGHFDKSFLFDTVRHISSNVNLL